MFLQRHCVKLKKIRTFQLKGVSEEIVPLSNPAVNLAGLKSGASYTMFSNVRKCYFSFQRGRQIK